MVPRWSRSLGTLCLYRMVRWELVSRFDVIAVPFACVPNVASPSLQKKVASHHHVRNKVGLFDVGHMVQTKYANDSSVLITRTRLTVQSPFHQIPRSDISSVPRVAHPILPRLPLPLLIHALGPGQRKRRDNRRHDHNQTLRRRLLRRHERWEA